MAKDYLILNPTTRNLITEIEPNNYAVPILEGRVFRDSVTDISLTLSATEINDTLSLAADVIVNTSFSITGATDTAAATAESIVSMLCGATEPADITEASAENIIEATCGIKERTDIVKILIPGSGKRVSGGDAVNWDELLRYFTPKKAVMTITENRDRARIVIETRADKEARAGIIETGDGTKFIFNIPSYSSMEISELRDGAARVDARLFREQVRKLNDDYEQNEMIIFALAS